MVYALLRVPVRSGVPAVLSSCRLCFMRPARLLACTRPRSATFFIVVHCPLSRFTLSVRLPLDTQEHITFSAVCQAKLLLFPFRVETKQRRSLDVSDYSTFGAVCQELFSSVRAMPSPAFTSSQCRSAFRCPAVVSSTVCMIPYAALFVNKYFSLFLRLLASGSDAVRYSELFGVVFSALFYVSVLFSHYNYFSAIGKEKCDLSFFDMLLNF